MLDDRDDDDRQRDDEVVREQRWIAFTYRASELIERRGLLRMLQDVTAVVRRGHPSESQGVELWLAAFVDEEGWDGVLTALGRGLRHLQARPTAEHVIKDAQRRHRMVR